MNQKLDIRKSLSHIISKIKSDWRMLLKICWFAFALECSVKILAHYWWLEQIEITHTAQTHVSLHQLQPFLNFGLLVIGEFLIAVVLVGLYRYLLLDQRFQLTTWVLRRDVLTTHPTLTLPLYFKIDRSVILLTIFFSVWQLSALYLRHYYLWYIYEERAFTDEASRWENLAVLQFWRYLQTWIDAQICLVYPYIAIATVISSKKIYENVNRLNGNGFRVFVVCFLILGFFRGLYYFFKESTNLLPKLLYYQHSYDYFLFTMLLNNLLKTLSEYSTAVCLAIFFAALFKLFGTKEGALPAS